MGESSASPEYWSCPPGHSEANRKYDAWRKWGGAEAVALGVGERQGDHGRNGDRVCQVVFPSCLNSAGDKPCGCFVGMGGAEDSGIGTDSWKPSEKNYPSG